MTDPQPDLSLVLSSLVDKVALELVFAEPGQDTGLLPVNDLLGQIAAHIAAEAAPAPIAQASPVLNVASDGELLHEFVHESREHLQNIELGVLTLEDHPTDTDTLNSIFRAFHTFKGGSGLLNLGPISKLAHELESLLDLARQHKLLITPEVINVILAGGDKLKQFLDEMQWQLNGQKPLTPIVVEMQALRARVRALVEGGSLAAPVALPAPIKEGARILSVGEGASSGDAANAAKDDRPKVNGARPSSGAAVKVDTQKLDSLVDLVGEMVISQSLVAQDPDVRGLQSQQLTRNLAQLARITKELQRVAMSLRMVPIRATFQKLIRLVRDLSAKSGKLAELALSGEDTELDRTITEEISDPLVHMIRNAVDHGVEKPDVRIAAGKPAQGVLSLRAFHQGGNIVIELADDGAGLCKERILAKALEQGLIEPGQSLSEKEVFALIFAPGFSTAATVTDISGRGVGMDVVRRNIEKLRGKIEIHSTPGRGTTFTIYLPLTLAIIDGLLVSVGNQRYILPTLAVRESLRPTAAMLSSVQGKGEMVNVRGRLIPLLRLSELFGVTPQSQHPTESVAVVIECDNQQRCLLVDRLLGKQEVVIKNLGEVAQESPALAGAAILGDGRVGLILDTSSLVKLRTAPLLRAA